MLLPSPLTPGTPLREALTAAWANSIRAALADLDRRLKTIAPAPSPDIRPRSAPGGTTYHLARRGRRPTTDTTHPWKATIAGDDTLLISPGVVQIYFLNFDADNQTGTGFPFQVAPRERHFFPIFPTIVPAGETFANRIPLTEPTETTVNFATTFHLALEVSYSNSADPAKKSIQRAHITHIAGAAPVLLGDNGGAGWDSDNTDHVPDPASYANTPRIPLVQWDPTTATLTQLRRSDIDLPLGAEDVLTINDD